MQRKWVGDSWAGSVFFFFTALVFKVAILQFSTNSVNTSYGEEIKLPAPPQVSHIAGGMFHTCVIADGKPWCWGDNEVGQTKIPETASQEKSIFIAAGDYHTCVILESGKVVCWGENTSGQTEVPKELSPATSPATSLALGTSHSCAITKDRKAAHRA